MEKQPEKGVYESDGGRMRRAADRRYLSGTRASSALRTWHGVTHYNRLTIRMQ
jgi:hypothetical protein